MCFVLLKSKKKLEMLDPFLSFPFLLWKVVYVGLPKLRNNLCFYLLVHVHVYHPTCVILADGRMIYVLTATMATEDIKR